MTIRKPRRRLATLLCLLALSLPALALSGCGAIGHYVGGVVAHRVANHLVGVRHANQLFCLYHGHRVLVDARTHHLLAAGLNAYSAYHSCRSGFGRSG
jgi:hypothetical protein